MPSQNQIHTEITNRIVEALKKNQAPWRKPWRSANQGNPCNVVSRKLYRGINPLLLQIASWENGYESKFWGTYKQWSSLKGQVRKGERGTKIVFWKVIEKEKKADSDEMEKIFLLRHYSVFCLDQVSGDSLDNLRPQLDDAIPFEDWEPAEKLIQATEADIQFGGDKAFYRCPTPAGSWPNHTEGDFIRVPNRRRFPLLRDWYDTIFHELAHWSEVRLGFEASYAMCELVAEMTACFLANQLGVPQSDDLENHNRYLSDWLERMENDPRWIFRAAQQASQVTDFLMSFVSSEVTEEEPVATG